MELLHINPLTPVMAIIPQYRIEWADDSCFWGVSPQPHGGEPQIFSFDIAPGHLLVFDLVAPNRLLTSLLVQLATHRRTNTVHIWCELSEESGRVLARSYIEPASIVDNAYCRVLDLRGIEFEIGRRYRVCLTSPEASPGNSFAAWVFATEPGHYELPRKLMRFRDERRFIYQDRPPVPATNAELKCALAVMREPDGSINLRSIFDTVSNVFPGATFDVVELDSPTQFWPSLSAADVVIFADVRDPSRDPGHGFNALCGALHRIGTCTIFLDKSDLLPRQFNPALRYSGQLKREASQRHEIRRRCHFILLAGAPPRLLDAVTDQEIDSTTSLGMPQTLSNLVSRLRSVRMPKVAIVSVLYRKSDVIEMFLSHVIHQNYPGEIKVVLVDDQSPENERELAQQQGLKLKALGVANRSILTLFNTENLGNCSSRLTGMAAVDADIYIIIDCDCLLNADFVAAHVFEHAWHDVDAVIGPINIESAARDTAALVSELERHPERIPIESNPQDPIQPDGFVNCITRNFSIKKRCLADEPLFDLDFSYSQKPDSGFGWEDVEMGYRLYLKAAVIRFTRMAFSVHCSHVASTTEQAKVRGSIRNFERLFVKHPDMALVARRWALDTYEKLMTWAKSQEVDAGEIQRSLERRFAATLDERRDLILSYRPGARRLRILSYRWHVPHQYELYKLPHEFTLVTDLHNDMVDGWGYEQRRLLPNVRMVPSGRINACDFDLVILHFDENVLDPYLCNGVIPAQWGHPFEWGLELPDLPKIAICHGTPQFRGQYGLDPNRKAHFEVYDEERCKLVDRLAAAKAKVVCNSYQALQEWDFRDSRVIWHGFDPQEFPAGTYERDVLALEPDRHRPHYRGAWEHEQVARSLDPTIRIETAAHLGAALELRESNDFAVRNFRSYVDRVRQFTVYLNTTLRSPMPRARGEAMMCGVIPVCLNNHDVDRFIERGVNGFFSNEPGELADFINHLHRHRGAAARIGAAARRTALDAFNHDRYLAAWTKLIKDAIG